jgi:hypothetical protein
MTLTNPGGRDGRRCRGYGQGSIIAVGAIGYPVEPLRCPRSGSASSGSAR